MADTEVEIATNDQKQESAEPQKAEFESFDRSNIPRPNTGAFSLGLGFSFWEVMMFGFVPDDVTTAFSASVGKVQIIQNPVERLKVHLLTFRAPAVNA